MALALHHNMQAREARQARARQGVIGATGMGMVPPPLPPPPVMASADNAAAGGDYYEPTAPSNPIYATIQPKSTANPVYATPRPVSTAAATASHPTAAAASAAPAVPGLSHMVTNTQGAGMTAGLLGPSPQIDSNNNNNNIDNMNRSNNNITSMANRPRPSFARPLSDTETSIEPPSTPMQNYAGPTLNTQEMSNSSTITNNNTSNTFNHPMLSTQGDTTSRHVHIRNPPTTSTVSNKLHPQQQQHPAWSESL